MRGKVCIVTGGNTGIGKATVEGLAKLGATVIMACRDQEKGRAALEEIKTKTGSTELHLLPLDLASLQSVREFAKTFAERFDRLDVLVENAGVSTGKRQVTADGFEMDFGVNHLGHFLLTELLLPRLEASAPSRIIVLSSSVHKSAKPIEMMSCMGCLLWRKIRPRVGSTASAIACAMPWDVMSVAKRVAPTTSANGNVTTRSPLRR